MYKSDWKFKLDSWCNIPWFAFDRIKFEKKINLQANAFRIFSVVYFDQHLGAVHSKHWLRYVFSRFFVLKSCFLGCYPAVFFSTSAWELGKNILIFYHFCIKILQKYGKYTKEDILTRVWSEQHPNAGRNVQQTH